MKKYVFLLFLSLILNATYAQRINLNDGLIAFYRFNATTQDASKFKNNGNIVGGVDYSPDRFGNRCSAAQFNGYDGFVRVPSSPSLNAPQDEVSISVWIKVSLGGINQSNFKWFTVCCKSDVSGENEFHPHYRLQGSSKTASIGTGPVATRRFNFKMNIEEEKWYHYALVYDGAMIRIYVDGKELYSYAYSKQLYPNDRPLEIGRDVPGALEYHKGSMDDLRIYDRALNKAEIFALYRDDTEKNTKEDRCPQNSQTQIEIPKPDTVVVVKTDTVFVDTPITQTVTKTDTVYIDRPITNTITKTDTVFITQGGGTSTTTGGGSGTTTGGGSSTTGGGNGTNTGGGGSDWSIPSTPHAGDKFKLEHVRFVQSKPILLAESYPDLKELIELLQKYETMVIQLEGHTDDQGPANLNMTLSRQRVQVVKNYLIEKGNIDENRLKTKAFGECCPMASNSTESTRKLNRRVEVRILSMD